MTEEQENGETPEARRDRAFRELVRLGEEMDLYDTEPTVCVSHMRFVPCRRGYTHPGTCSLSSSQEDIDRVTRLSLDEMRKARDEYRRSHGGPWEKVPGEVDDPHNPT